MGHREARRVPMDFVWPLGEVWEGYINPYEYPRCLACDGQGYSPEYNHYRDLWYGYIPFKPEDNGSTPFSPDHPYVRAFAERNVTNAHWYYGSGSGAIQREAERLATLWNGSWGHHLNQDDVDALVADNRLWDFTRTWSRETGWQEKDPPYVPNAAEVNDWSIRGMGHDSMNSWSAIKARCAREGLPNVCAACDGKGYPPEAEEAHAIWEAYEWVEPPEGPGWQMWERVSEGSPKSPVFATPEELADWCAVNATVFADERWTAEQWLESFVEGTTGVDSLMVATSDGRVGTVKNLLD